MTKEMNTEEKAFAAIDILLNKIDWDVKSDDALRYTQAAANIAHMRNILIQKKE